MGREEAPLFEIVQDAGDAGKRGRADQAVEEPLLELRHPVPDLLELQPLQGVPVHAHVVVDRGKGRRQHLAHGFEQRVLRDEHAELSLDLRVLQELFRVGAGRPIDLVRRVVGAGSDPEQVGAQRPVWVLGIDRLYEAGDPDVDPLGLFDRPGKHDRVPDEQPVEVREPCRYHGLQHRAVVPLLYPGRSSPSLHNPDMGVPGPRAPGSTLWGRPTAGA